MKYLTLITIFIGFSIGTKAQYVPDFETQLYFEDAIGNKDTVTIGYDSTSTEELDPHLGEFEILIPFDSTFEVRVGNGPGSFYPERLSKKIIAFSERIFNTRIRCWGGTDINIYIQAKHNPVKVSWDRSAYDGEICQGSALLTNQQQDVLIFPYDWDNDDPNAVYYCMGQEHQFTFDTDIDSIDQPIDPIFIEKEVEGKGLQTIYGIRYTAFSWPQYPCFYTNTDEVEEMVQSTYAIYPNPVTDYLFLDRTSTDIKTINLKIYDMQGRLIESVDKLTDNRINVSGLLAGLYLLSIEEDAGRLHTQKFLKL